MAANGLGSLFEVLAVNAQFYTSIGQLYEEYMRGVPSAMTRQDAFLDPTQLGNVLNTLKNLHKECVGMHLSVSAAVLQSTIANFEKATPRFKESQAGLECWYNCFNAELAAQPVWVVLPHRAQYILTNGPGLGLALMKAIQPFRDGFYDAYEAGHCFAFERFSACVYHLMRLSEHGLVSVAASLNVPNEKLSKGWDGCIQGIESAIKTISSTKPTQDWQDQVKKYSDLCSWFTVIKSGWRNPSSHVPRIYTEQSASGIYSATVTLFEHLTIYGFQQTAMPSDPLQLPQE